MVGLGDLHTMEVLLFVMGLALISSLHYRNINGSILIGIVAISVAFWALNGWPTSIFSIPEIEIFKLDFGPVLSMNPSQWCAPVPERDAQLR